MYNEVGRDEEGYDREGYSLLGYDRQGYDREGYSLLGYDRQGYDKLGYDNIGLDRLGNNNSGGGYIITWGEYGNSVIVPHNTTLTQVFEMLESIGYDPLLTPIRVVGVKI